MTNDLLLRRRIRMILSALPTGRRASERLLFDLLRPDLPELRAEELRVSLEWNLGKGYIDYKHNGDEERDEWFLTERGREKEGL